MKSYLKVFMALLVAGVMAHAEDLTGKWGISGIAQATHAIAEKTLRDFSDDIGHDFGAMVRYGFNKNLSLGLSYENMNLGNSIRIEPIILQGLYNFMPESRLAPVLTLGAGSSATAADGKFDNISAKAGIGLDYTVAPNFTVGPQVAYHFISSEGSNDVPAHVLTGGLVASYFFGGASSPAPVVEQKPEPVAQPVAAAPTPIDSDKDGVMDDQDNCPNTPVGVAVDGRGCAPDSDGDGVADYMDKCPDTMKGVAVNAEGCPLSTPQKVSIDLNVLFDTGKAIVKPEYASEIKKVADFMKTYADTRTVIEGHTDNVGSVAGNTALSQRRADAVRNELISKFGIAADRVSAKGFGPSKPLVDNSTAENRAKNRRVVAAVSAVKK